MIYDNHKNLINRPDYVQILVDIFRKKKSGKLDKLFNKIFSLNFRQKEGIITFKI